MLLAVASLLNAIPSLAQADDALRAVRVQHYIMLDYSTGTKTIRFATDAGTPREHFHPLGTEQLFAVTNGRNINVALRYLNPLRYSWRSSQSLSRDPLVESVEKFLASADVLLGLISSSGGVTAVAPTPGPSTSPAAPTGAPVQTPTLSTDGYIDPTLLEWGLWTGTVKWAMQSDKAALATAQQFAHRLDLLLAGDQRTEQLSTVSSAADFRAATVEPVKLLLDAASVRALRASTDSLRLAIGRLTSANNAARALSKSLKEAGEALALLADAKMLTRRDTVLQYSRRALHSVAQRAGLVIVARELIVTELGQVLIGLDALLRDTPDDALAFSVAAVSVPSGQRSAVTVEIAERKVDVSSTGIASSDVGTTSVTFNVMERQSLVPELTQGVAYSNLVYPEFRTNDTPAGHVVANVGARRPRALAIAMLNLIPNTGWSGFTRTVAQLGIGATSESPVLLTGAGIRFTQPAKFTLTVGAAFPFVQRLKTLSVGSTVAGEAALKQDLERRLGTPALYIGIQR